MRHLALTLAALSVAACQPIAMASKSDNRGQTVTVPVAEYKAIKAANPTRHPAFTICGHGARDMQMNADKTAWKITC